MDVAQRALAGGRGEVAGCGARPRKERHEHRARRALHHRRVAIVVRCSCCARSARGPLRRRRVHRLLLPAPRYGVPVTVTEWLALMRGLAMGLVPTGLDQFYAVARSILVKSEAYFDQYDQAFAAHVQGHRDAGGDRRRGLGLARRPADDARAHRRGTATAGRRSRGPGPGGAPRDVRGAPQGADGGPSRRQLLGGHRWHQRLRPLRLPPRRHPRGRREPQPQRRQGGRRAPLPRLPHRPRGGRAAVRARPATPSSAVVAQRRRPR